MWKTISSASNKGRNCKIKHNCGFAAIEQKQQKDAQRDTAAIVCLWPGLEREKETSLLRNWEMRARGCAPRGLRTRPQRSRFHPGISGT